MYKSLNGLNVETYGVTLLITRTQCGVCVCSRHTTLPADSSRSYLNRVRTRHVKLRSPHSIRRSRERSDVHSETLPASAYGASFNGGLVNAVVKRVQTQMMLLVSQNVLSFN